MHRPRCKNVHIKTLYFMFTCDVIYDSTRSLFLTFTIQHLIRTNFQGLSQLAALFQLCMSKMSQPPLPPMVYCLKYRWVYARNEAPSSERRRRVDFGAEGVGFLERRASPSPAD